MGLGVMLIILGFVMGMMAGKQTDKTSSKYKGYMALAVIFFVMGLGMAGYGALAGGEASPADAVVEEMAKFNLDVKGTKEKIAQAVNKAGTNAVVQNRATAQAAFATEIQAGVEKATRAAQNQANAIVANATAKAQQAAAAATTKLSDNLRLIQEFAATHEQGLLAKAQAAAAAAAAEAGA